METNLAHIFEKYNLGNSNIYFSPRIPEKKLNNAVSTYASMANPNEVILLLDETVFGAAKDGLLLTPQGLFCHEMLTDPIFFPLCNIKDIWAQKKDIYINQTKFFSCNILDKQNIQHLCKLLLELVQTIQENNSNSTSPTNSTQTIQADNNSTSAAQKNDVDDKLATAVPTCNFDNIFEDIFNKYSFGNEKIFFAPRIPASKLANALTSYAPKIVSNEVLMLGDDTLMGGAKEGFILTRSQLFFHEFLTEPVTIQLTDIESVVAKDQVLTINGKKVFEATQLDKVHLRALANLISEVAEKQLLSTLSKEELAERGLFRELSQRKEYFFLALYKNILRLHKIDAISNSIDIFCDQFFAISQKQENEAWDRNSQEENNFNEAIAITAHSLLGLAFELPLSISKDFENNKVISHIAISDCIAHEILCYLLIRGTLLIYDAFSLDDNKDYYVSLYTENIFINRILLPFYKEKVSQCNSINSLKKVALQNNLQQIFKDIINERKLLNRAGEDIHFASRLVCHRISYGLIFNGGQCSLETLVSNELPQTIDTPQTLQKYCEAVQSTISDEMESFLSYADEKLEKILMKLFS